MGMKGTVVEENCMHLYEKRKDEENVKYVARFFRDAHIGLGNIVRSIVY